MATTFISTNSISTTLRISAMKSQVALSRATEEATSGRFADVGMNLGALTGRDVVLRAELRDVDKLVDTNALIAGRLDVAQQRVGELIDTAQEFQKALFAARNSADGGNIIAQPASANLQSLIATLNVTMDGQHLFGGINTAVKPITDYAAGSTSKTAVDAAFLADFGVAQNSPLVSGITAADMQTFLDTTFKAEFDDPAWGANWSAAADQTMRSRISTTETITSSASANEPAFRKLAMAYTMLSDLGTQNLNQTGVSSSDRHGDRSHRRRDQRSGRSWRQIGDRPGADHQRHQPAAGPGRYHHPAGQCHGKGGPGGGVGQGYEPAEPAGDVAGAHRAHPEAQHPRLSLIANLISKQSTVK